MLTGVAVARPLDVHRALVVLLDDQRLAGERHQVRIAQAEAPPLRLGYVHRLHARRRALRRVHHLHRLAAEVAAHDRRACPARSAGL